MAALSIKTTCVTGIDLLCQAVIYRHKKPAMSYKFRKKLRESVSCIRKDLFLPLHPPTVHLAHTVRISHSCHPKFQTDMATLLLYYGRYHKPQVCLLPGKFLAEQGRRNCFHHLAVLLQSFSPWPNDPRMATNTIYVCPCCLNTSSSCSSTAPAPQFVSKGLAQLPFLIQDLVSVYLGNAPGYFFIALLFLPRQLSSGACSRSCQKRWDNMTFISMMHLQSLEMKFQI